MNSYANHQLARALTTAATHEDDATRRRADDRARRWIAVLEGMAGGSVSVGSRMPVRGLPAWATLEVVRGGFATGRAVAERPLEDDEIAILAATGHARSRRELFRHHLSEPGWAALWSLLESGAYTIRFPEEAALLTAVWLAAAGDRAGALDLVDELWPYADRMRFTPVAAERPGTPPDHVFRMSAGAAREVLARRPPNLRIERQREALAVWAPFADRVLDLWLETAVDGRVDACRPDGWLDRARDLLAEYDALASTHTLTRKHRDPKQNLAILVHSLRQAVDGAPVRTARPHYAATAMLAKRGRPGSEQHSAARRPQREVAAAPAHATLAHAVADRLEAVPPAVGLVDPDAMGGPLNAAEAQAIGAPMGTPVPRSVHRTLDRARSAPLTELAARGLVPSGEVLAELAPALGATVVGRAFSDPALSRLVADSYRAFRARRSLLLLDLASQVRIGELPWVAATAAHPDAPTDDARGLAAELSTLALDLFPGTVLPNRLVVEIDALLTQAGTPACLLQELAADIFMGEFSDRFRRSAQHAVPSYAGGVYAAYYDIDVEAVMAATTESERCSRWPVRGSEASQTFSAICRDRVAAADGWSVAHNGMIIEQAQILTTHNLAAIGALVATGSWAARADVAFDHAVALLRLAHTQQRPLATVKSAAYAWRQCLWFLTQAPSHLPTFLERQVPTVPGLAAILGGLRHVAAGGRFDENGTCPGGRRFLGWTVERHWVLT